MPSLSLLHWLLIGSFGFSTSLMVMLVLLWRRQNQIAGQLNNTLQLVQQSQSALTQSTVGMGQRLKQLDSKVHHAERRTLLPLADEAMLAQASRLVQLGASANDLVDSCGVPRGEAELLVSLQRKHSQPQFSH